MLLIYYEGINAKKYLIIKEIFVYNVEKKQGNIYTILYYGD